MLGDETYSWEILNNDATISEFEKGKKYTFNMTLIQITITAWDPIAGGNGTAN